MQGGTQSWRRALPLWKSLGEMDFQGAPATLLGPAGAGAEAQHGPHAPSPGLVLPQPMLFFLR